MPRRQHADGRGERSQATYRRARRRAGEEERSAGDMVRGEEGSTGGTKGGRGGRNADGAHSPWRLGRLAPLATAHAILEAAVRARRHQGGRRPAAREGGRKGAGSRRWSVCWMQMEWGGDGGRGRGCGEGAGGGSDRRRRAVRGGAGEARGAAVAAAADTGSTQRVGCEEEEERSSKCEERRGVRRWQKKVGRDGGGRAGLAGMANPRSSFAKKRA